MLVQKGSSQKSLILCETLSKVSGELDCQDPGSGGHQDLPLPLKNRLFLQDECQLYWS